MAQNYTYPVIDPALRNFLVVVLMFLVFVSVAVAVGISFEIIDLPMAFEASSYSEEAGDIVE
ncbi:hypothetical protein [Halalkalicoccus salilacus]|uniref:hypothetical protein n=1 Tax=Halalkalicoccus salilacus TaxID=3117459 RepID=UPI00300F409E